MIAKTRRLAAAIVSVSALLVAATACSSSNTSGKGGGDVTLNLPGGDQSTENFNPFSPTRIPGTDGFLYEPLFFYNNIKGLADKPLGNLGDSFSWNSAGTELTVTVKSGVTWSDGTPFTAKDVAFTFNTRKDNPALRTSSNPPAAEAVDETHVKLTFTRASFLDAPGVLGSTNIVPEHVWKAKTDPAKDANTEPVGTGPFVLKSYTPQSWLLARNPKFRDADKVKLAGVRFTATAGNTSVTDKLLAGEFDWTQGFIPDMTKVLARKPGLAYAESGNGIMINIVTCANAALGCTGPQTDPAVRKAISQAMDRGQINKLAFNDVGKPVSASYAVPGRDDQFISAPFNTPIPTTADVAGAKKTLEAAGWQPGPDGLYAKGGAKLNLTIRVVTGFTDYIAALTALAQQLKTAGIGLTLQRVSYNENQSVTAAGSFQLAMTVLGFAPAPDPYYIYEYYFGTKNTARVGDKDASSLGNVSRFSDPRVDALVAQAAGTEDAAARAKIYASIQPILAESLPYIPIVNNVQYAQFNTAKVTGFPSESDPYASAGYGSSPDNVQVLTRLRPS
ncbi:ABC transporter substrate-binding protein [Micromonospora sp. 067-2]|uniref:ABC transporter substrate-binding protein n=1 Tax=Micromonospora sp. 067-2 TaxID=2789270 RepID=UPI00397C6065